MRVTEQDGRLLRIDEQGRTLSWDGRGEGWASGQRTQTGGGGLFDRVLVDVPCSGSGRAQYFAGQDGSEDALSSEAVSEEVDGFPEHREGRGRRKTSADLVSERYQVEGGSASAAARQQALLWNGARLLRPGGFLVYSTCSLWREENEDVVAFLLSHNHDMQLVDVTLPKEHIMSMPEMGPAREGAPGAQQLASGPSLLRRVRSDLLVEVLNDHVPNSAMPGWCGGGGEDMGLKGGVRRKALSRNGMEKSVRVLPGEYFEGFFMAKLRKAKAKRL